MIDRPDVIVVGAGFAGVAAATALAERGASVLVLETRQRPGGRAYSWTDPKTGEIRDNGQHVLASFYHETMRLLKRIGTESALVADPTFRLHLWERGRGDFDIACPRFPAPFHWLAALFSCNRLSMRSRAVALSLRERARALLAGGDDGKSLTVEEWLRRVSGNEDIAAFLRPVALAALNEDPREGSAMLFAGVLDRLLGASAEESGLALPRRGLGDLLHGFEDFVATRGGEVRFRTTALSVRIEENRAAGVSLLGGANLDAGTVILAVPHERLGWMVPSRHLGAHAGIADVPWSPIVSTVHFYDRPVLPSRFVGLSGTPTQWAFVRGATAEGWHAVGTVRSAAVADIERPLDAIAEETARDLAEAFPRAREAKLVRARVYKERRATMRATPGVQRLRPPTETAVRGLYLAGDWTDTGLPPTIESAVLSGHRAASLSR